MDKDLGIEVEAVMEIDKEMQADGWHLEVSRYEGNWRVVYMHPIHLMESAKGETMFEAIRKASQKAIMVVQKQKESE